MKENSKKALLIIPNILSIVVIVVISNVTSIKFPIGTLLSLFFVFTISLLRRFCETKETNTTISIDIIYAITNILLSDANIGFKPEFLWALQISFIGCSVFASFFFLIFLYKYSAQDMEEMKEIVIFTLEYTFTVATTIVYVYSVKTHCIIDNMYEYGSFIAVIVTCFLVRVIFEIEKKDLPHFELLFYYILIAELVLCWHFYLDKSNDFLITPVLIIVSLSFLEPPILMAWNKLEKHDDLIIFNAMGIIDLLYEITEITNIGASFKLCSLFTLLKYLGLTYFEWLVLKLEGRERADNDIRSLKEIIGDLNYACSVVIILGSLIFCILLISTSNELFNGCCMVFEVVSLLIALRFIVSIKSRSGEGYLIGELEQNGDIENLKEITFINQHDEIENIIEELLNDYGWQNVEIIYEDYCLPLIRTSWEISSEYIKYEFKITNSMLKILTDLQSIFKGKDIVFKILLREIIQHEHREFLKIEFNKEKNAHDKALQELQPLFLENCFIKFIEDIIKSSSSSLNQEKVGENTSENSMKEDEHDILLYWELENEKENEQSKELDEEQNFYEPVSHFFEKFLGKKIEDHDSISIVYDKGVNDENFEYGVVLNSFLFPELIYSSVKKEKLQNKHGEKRVFFFKFPGKKSERIDYIHVDEVHGDKLYACKIFDEEGDESSFGIEEDSSNSAIFYNSICDEFSISNTSENSEQPKINNKTYINYIQAEKKTIKIIYKNYEKASYEIIIEHYMCEQEEQNEAEEEELKEIEEENKQQQSFKWVYHNRRNKNYQVEVYNCEGKLQWDSNKSENYTFKEGEFFIQDDEDIHKFLEEECYDEISAYINNQGNIIVIVNGNGEEIQITYDEFLRKKKLIRFVDLKYFLSFNYSKKEAKSLSWSYDDKKKEKDKRDLIYELDERGKPDEKLSEKKNK